MSAARPAGEEDGVGAVGDLLGRAEPCGADRVEAVEPPGRVAEDRDEPSHDARRKRLAASSVPITVTTSRNAFFPCSFDSPLARSRMSTGTSATRSPASCSRSTAWTSGAPLVYGCASAGSAFAEAA